MVAPGSRVLDVGCGDGALLQLLAETKSVDGRGVELSRERVNACVARGLSVIQGDADRDLVDYPDQAFDYAILSLTDPGDALSEDGAREPAAHRPARHRLVPEFRPLAHPHGAPVHRPHAADPQPARALVRRAPTRTCAPSRTSPISSPWSTPRSRRPSPSTAPASACRSTTRSRCRTCSARRPCSSSPARAKSDPERRAGGLLMSVPSRSGRLAPRD